MIGCGARGDKRRTIRYQDGIVTDHVLDVRVSLREYLRGDFGNIIP
jgi:protein subunit release factor A